MSKELLKRFFSILWDYPSLKKKYFLVKLLKANFTLNIYTFNSIDNVVDFVWQYTSPKSAFDIAHAIVPRVKPDIDASAVESVRCFWIDFDSANLPKVLFDMASIVVSSGHNFHLYFLLQEELNVPDFFKLHLLFRHFLKKKFFGVYLLNLLGPDAFMRTPLTYNRKGTKRRRVSIVKLEEKRWQAKKIIEKVKRL